MALTEAQPISIRRVAVAGPNGTLGPSVLKHLLSAGFQVTILTRDAARPASKIFPEINVSQVDYSSTQSLVTAMQGHDALVILINRNAIAVQIRVIDAAVEANVPHIIPSCFGLGTRDPYMRTLPPLAEKVEMEDYVVRRSKEGAFTFTGIQTSLLLDWALPIGALINIQGGITRLFDGGDRLISVTTLDTSGEAVAAALLKYEETRNRFLYIQDMAISQQHLLKLSKVLRPNKPWETTSISTADIEAASWEAWEKGDRSPTTMRGFLQAASWGKGQHGLFKKLDNALLGIKEKDNDFLQNILSNFIYD